MDKVNTESQARIHISAIFKSFTSAACEIEEEVKQDQNESTEDSRK